MEETRTAKFQSEPTEYRKVRKVSRQWTKFGTEHRRQKILLRNFFTQFTTRNFQQFAGQFVERAMSAKPVESYQRPGERFQSATVGKEAFRAYNSDEIEAARGQRIANRQEGNWMEGGGVRIESRTAAKDSYRAYDSQESLGARGTQIRRAGNLTLGGEHMETETENRVPYYFLNGMRKFLGICIRLLLICGVR